MQPLLSFLAVTASWWELCLQKTGVLVSLQLYSTNCALSWASPVQSLVSQQRGSLSALDVHHNQKLLLPWQIWLCAGKIQGEFSPAFSAFSYLLTRESGCPEYHTTSAGTSGWFRQTLTVMRVKKLGLQVWRRQAEGSLNDDKGVLGFFPIRLLGM